MKKDELLGMEVYYEDNPQPHHCPVGHEGRRGERGIPAPKPAGLPKSLWVFGDSDEEDDFDDIYGESDNYGLYKDKDEDEFDAKAWIINNGDDKEAEQESLPVPIRGRIYFVKGLSITAKLKEIRPLTKVAGILQMSHHGSVFYINPSDLRKASPEQVTRYLEESD